MVWGLILFWERLHYCEDLPLVFLLWSHLISAYPEKFPPPLDNVDHLQIRLSQRGLQSLSEHWSTVHYPRSLGQRVCLAHHRIKGSPTSHSGESTFWL